MTSTTNDPLLDNPPAWRCAGADALPLAAAVTPFGLAIGAAGATAELSLFETLFGAAVLLAGAAQLATTDALANGDGLGALLIVVCLMNARFMLYSIGLSAWFRGRPTWRRVLLSLPIIDQTFLLCQQRFADVSEQRWRERYYLAATTMLVITYLASQAVGHGLGANLPDELGLHLATPLVFVGMLATTLSDRGGITAASVAASVLVVSTPGLGAAALPAAVITGIVVGGAVAPREMER